MITMTRQNIVLKRVLVSLICLFLALLLYIPHTTSPFPFYVDEWHHINEAIRLSEGTYSGGTQGYRLGFHVFLAALSVPFDLVLFYKYFPALWGIICGLTFFWYIRTRSKNSEKGFAISILTLIFFTSLKSNVNIAGLFFFTPLIFSIPFIFLYLYFFEKGLKEDSLKHIGISLGIMLFLLFTYSIAIFFAIPILLFLMYQYREVIFRRIPFFSLFLIIPIAGIFFHMSLLDVSFTDALGQIAHKLLFWEGWDPEPRLNSPLELYSFIGYVLAFVGLLVVLCKPVYRKRYALFAFWSVSVLFVILLHVFFDLSPFSPYKRNLYFFALSLPLLSAVGLYYLFTLLKERCKKLDIQAQSILYAVLGMAVFVLTFYAYYDAPEASGLYEIVNEVDYDAFSSLRDAEDGYILADPLKSMAVFPIADKEPIGAMHFYGRRTLWKTYEQLSTCEEKDALFTNPRYNITYLYTYFPKDCDWELLYSNNSYIYRVR